MFCKILFYVVGFKGVDIQTLVWFLPEACKTAVRDLECDTVHSGIQLPTSLSNVLRPC
jgi:hypothetical protein